MAQKKNIIYNLIDRAIKLSDSSFHNLNMTLVKRILHDNDYDTEFIEEHVRKIKFQSVNPNHSQKIY